MAGRENKDIFRVLCSNLNIIAFIHAVFQYTLSLYIFIIAIHIDYCLRGQYASEVQLKGRLHGIRKI